MHGRIKEMIIRGGESIYLREIEDVLCMHPCVSLAVVVGCLVLVDHFPQTASGEIRKFALREEFIASAGRT
jgi:fatty-acyl-CoA synthase